MSNTQRSLTPKGAGERIANKAQTEEGNHKIRAEIKQTNQQKTKQYNSSAKPEAVFLK